MKHRQKAIIVSKDARGEEGLEALNRHLKNGWHVVHAVSMGGAAGNPSAENDFLLAALVIIERSGMHSGAEVELAEAEEALEEMDGNGAPEELLEEIRPGRAGA